MIELHIVIFIDPKISEWIDDYKLFIKMKIPFTLAPATSTVTTVTETPETTQIVTSTAVPTTTETSTAAGTTITICDYIQGMISASYVPDSHIDTSPTLDDKSVIRYGVDGPSWIVSPSDDPKVTLTLTDPVTGEAPYVKKIIISPHVNVEKVKLTMTKELDNGNQIQIEDTVALDERGEIVLEQAVKLVSVKIKVKTYTDSSQNMEIKIGVLACFCRTQYVLHLYFFQIPIFQMFEISKKKFC